MFDLTRFTVEWWWRRCHAGTNGREFDAQLEGVVRRRRSRDDVPLRGVDAVRRPRHLRIPLRMAVGPRTHSGAHIPGAQRRSHLRHAVNFHLHAGTGTSSALPQRPGSAARKQFQRHRPLRHAPTTAPPPPPAAHVKQQQQQQQQ